MIEPSIVVDFPLRGEWIAPNTPGTKIPSHGTDQFGERYAFDFVGLEPGSRHTRFYRASTPKYLLLGARLEDCFGWGRPIYAATAGRVIRAEDGWPERNPAHLARDLFMLVKNSGTDLSVYKQDLRMLTGNYVLIESAEGFGFYAHAQTGSVRVSAGERVEVGQHLANVGHSGNSTAPHLHFQMMDREDPWTAQGIFCAFRAYQVLEGESWLEVQNGVPKATQRIRRVG